MSEDADASSEEWTGDDDFLPRSARRRHREQRLARRQANATGSTPVQQSLSRRSPQPYSAKERPTSMRASRFQPAMSEPWHVTGSTEQIDKPFESGPSDADDEDDSSNS
ncbi:hypothetical protein LTR36_005541 [Oleoguttula mirabilis]|uniref:Uncharacterized protein n=1 Tax=Oleoguttula mirabilis TaxID=1507867 RepID=A0AAV9JE06_9PEZI|nr:hypothetical protein LTR36_005541 [Oleoguttula mirabilis]